MRLPVRQAISEARAASAARRRQMPMTAILREQVAKAEARKLMTAIDLEREARKAVG
jgi:hypothetical protein